MITSGRPSRKISLVLSDVDGSLLTPEKALTGRAIRAVRALDAAGIAFAIASSRPPRGLTMLIAPLALKTPIAGFNGGVYVHPDMSMIESHTLDPNIAGRIVDLILGKGLDAWVYTPDTWLIRNPNAPHVVRETSTVRFDAKVVPNFTYAHLAHAVKIVGVCDDRDRVAVCEMKVQAEFGEWASVTRSQPYYLDVTDRQANKGMVVATLARILNVPAAEIAALGDTSNDVLMFHESGFSIAMGNANAEVKSQANAVTDTNENEGFAHAMEKFILGRIETSDEDKSR